MVQEASLATGLLHSEAKRELNQQTTRGKKIDQQEAAIETEEGKMEFTFSKSVAVALLTMGLVASSFGGGYIWNNDGVTTGNGAPFYLDEAGQDPLPTGDLIQLATIQGGTNFVLASAYIGDTGFKGDGWFQIVSPNLSGANVESVLEVIFYNTNTTSGAYGIVYNRTIMWQPNKAFGIDIGDNNFAPAAGAGKTTGGNEVYGPGFYIDSIPEPSTMMLVGLGLLGAVGLRRRHRS